jgi:predicted anti-sigma-YlaC factor YlaD
MYANAFVQGPAERLPQARYAEREEAKERAKRLYLRGLNLLYRGLELKYPGFSASFQGGTLGEFLPKMTIKDIPALYWSAAGGLSAFSLNPFDMTLGVRIPEFLALVNRAYELNPDYNSGALDEFLLLFHASIPESMGGDKSKIDFHYQNALEKSQGGSAGTYVSYAQAVLIPAQNYDKFKELLDTALAIDVNKNPSTRLVNILAQQKARYLLDSAYMFFIGLDDDW